MFFDLNVPIPNLYQATGPTSSKKGKGKQPSTNAPVVFTPAQINALEARVDLMVRLGYTVIAFNQLVHKKVEPKTHVNTVESLLGQLRKRPGIVYLKRLSIILDEDSEKGFGLTNASAALFPSYDIIGLVPLTQTTFSLACLTHSMPSPLTAHIISLPLTLPRLSFYLKHTLIRTAIKNGAVFEISYVGALGGENDPVLVGAGAAENGAGAKRNWWASTRELARVTKGKSLLVSGGVVGESDLRAPNDVANLITILGLAQDGAHATLTKTPKSLVLRAQTRQTYRAVFSEPKLVIPEGFQPQEVPPEEHPETVTEISQPPLAAPPLSTVDVTPCGSGTTTPHSHPAPKKRPRDREEGGEGGKGTPKPQPPQTNPQKKKRKKNNNEAQRVP